MPARTQRPSEFPDEIWEFQRALMRARSQEHLRRIAQALIHELIARDAQLLRLGFDPKKVYNVHEVLMFAKGCSLTPLEGGLGGGAHPRADE